MVQRNSASSQGWRVYVRFWSFPERVRGISSLLDIGTSRKMVGVYLQFEKALQY